MIPFTTIDQLRMLANKLYEKGETADAFVVASAISDVVKSTGQSDFYATTAYGACPFCGDYEALVQIGEKSFALCHEHRLFWYIGATPQKAVDENCEIAQLNRNLLASYSEIAIQAAFPTPACPCCGSFSTHMPWCILPISEPNNAD